MEIENRRNEDRAKVTDGLPRRYHGDRLTYNLRPGCLFLSNSHRCRSPDPAKTMDERVVIFGQDLCPYTPAARSDFARRKIPFEYINVLEDNAGLERMLELTKGRRKIPVIVDAGKITVGFGGS